MSEYLELASEALLLNTVLEQGVEVGVDVVERLCLNVQGRTRVEVREPGEGVETHEPVEEREPRLMRLCRLCRRHGLRAAPLAWYRGWRFGRRGVGARAAARVSGCSAGGGAASGAAAGACMANQAK